MALKMWRKGRKRPPEVRPREAARDDPNAARKWLDQQAREAGWLWANSVEGIAARRRQA